MKMLGLVLALFRKGIPKQNRIIKNDCSKLATYSHLPNIMSKIALSLIYITDQVLHNLQVSSY